MSMSLFFCLLAAQAFSPWRALALQQYPRLAMSALEVKGKEAVAPSSKYKLNDGREMPVIGFGTFRIKPGQATYDAVRTALKKGYRMIDTAVMYGNEADVGRAVRDSGIPRSEIFVTSKVWDFHHGYRQALRAGRGSNQALGLGYIDLYLIHSPGAFSPNGGKIVETYDALLQLQKEGIVRSVGVSNFGIEHLKALEEHGRPLPVVNQFEMHPAVFNARSSLVKHCKAKHILVQAYGSVLSGHQDLLEKASLVAKSHGKTNAQVMLRWALDQGFQVIPKSVHEDRIAQNLDVFDFTLTPAEAESLNNKAKDNGRLATEYWNPLDLAVDLGDVAPKTEKSEGDNFFKNAIDDISADAKAAWVRMMYR